MRRTVDQYRAAASASSSQNNDTVGRNTNIIIGPESKGRKHAEKNLGLSRPLVWMSDFDRTVLDTNCRKRNWIRCPNNNNNNINNNNNNNVNNTNDADDGRNDSWNVYWASVASARYLFNPLTRFRLRDDQIINHFPNHSQLTRKDTMVKNIKRYRREREKEAKGLPQTRDGTTMDVDFLPLTYVLPSEYALFVEEFRRNSSTPWIMKPADRSQGVGIFLVHRLSQVKRWAKRPSSACPSGMVSNSGSTMPPSLSSAEATTGGTPFIVSNNGPYSRRQLAEVCSSGLGGSKRASSAPRRRKSKGGGSVAAAASARETSADEDGTGDGDVAITSSTTRDGSTWTGTPRPRTGVNNNNALEPPTNSTTGPTAASSSSSFSSSSSSITSPHVISRYINNPLLIGSRKFDLRLYVLVTSFKPLVAYEYADGFARFCNEKYSNSRAHRKNHLVHLTNVSVQKSSEQYSRLHGGKLALDNLKLYLASTYGAVATNKLFSAISDIFAWTLRAVQPNMTSDKHCFECYGFDLLVDSNLKPWLIEVNASPAISATTAADRTLKMKLIDDVLNVACCRPPGCVAPSLLGGWSVLVDETTGLNRELDGASAVAQNGSNNGRPQSRREWR